MHLLDVLRSGKSGSVDAEFDQAVLEIEFGGDFGPLQAHVELDLDIAIAPETVLHLYVEAFIDGRSGDSFGPKHVVSLGTNANGVEDPNLSVPPGVFPDVFWQELDRRLHEAILKQWEHRAETPNLQEWGGKGSLPILANK